MQAAEKSQDLADEIILDLLRATWLIESARADLYRRWAQSESRYERAAERARRRAEIAESSLRAGNRDPDREVLPAHAAWLRALVGDKADEVPLGNLFVPRLGDWVERHALGFLVEGAEEMEELGREERAELEFPETFPTAPPYEPVETIPVDAPGKTTFRLGILGDTHFGAARSEAMAAAAIEDLNHSGADLVIQLGDLTDHGNEDEWELAAKTLARLEMPLVTMMGNHDVYSMKEQRLSGREYYKRFFGREPDGVVVEHKGFRLAVLDSVEHGASPFPPYDFASGSFVEGPGGAIVRGTLSVPQHDLLAEVAAPGTPPAFVFLHHPPQPYAGFPPILFGLRDQDSGRLHATVDSGNVWGVFAGHTHRNARTRTYGSVPVHEIGIPRDFPYGYVLLDVAREGYAFRFVQISNEELLRDAYAGAGVLFRRYGRGDETARGFVWTKS